METTRVTVDHPSRISNAAVKAQAELRSHPAKWTGVALGAGIGAGLLSRYLLHRRFHHHHREMPEVIVIGGAC